MNKTTTKRVKLGLRRRYRREKLFRLWGILAIVFSLACLLTLFTDIVAKGHGAFLQTYIRLTLNYDQDSLGLQTPVHQGALARADYDGLIKQTLRERFPGVEGRRDKRQLYQLVSSDAAFIARARLEENPALLGQSESLWLLADDDIDTYFKSLKDSDGPFTGRVGPKAQSWVGELVEQGDIELRFNREFFLRGDSREPEMAGILGAAKGSLFTMLVTLILSFPIGISAALYLEEFAPKNKWTDFIEVNINNLAAVPSIIFGLLGLAIFINFFHIPRSIPLLGGLVLTLMTLPTIIISSRAAIKAVPPSIREAARGIGASPMQVSLHHVLPLAMPGMLTGAIIGMAQALGETAPLLMIGMVAFIADIPSGIAEPATVLPVQIFLWADSPERAFIEKTSAAIMVLLAFLIVMNTMAVWLRKRLERRW